MSVKCPKCQHENPDTQSFCGDCGTKLPIVKDIEVTETLEIPKEELTTGSIFAGRYQIIEELGKGGMGRVYRVLDKELKEEVALKLIKPEIAKEKKTIERFKNELKVARRISHRNVGRMYELMEDRGTHFITMEYVPGQDLRGLIRQMGQLTTGKAIAIAKEICDGLIEAHRQGVVHRDLKPSNVIIDKQGTARILDFGIARSSTDKGITGAGVMIGTPEYMSPEQVEGKEIDRRSDIYSLGIILYEMVTGRVPFEGDTPFTVGVKHKSEIPKDPKELNTQIAEDLSRVILRCLEKDKEKRYQSVGDFRYELANVENGLPTTDRVLPKKPQTSEEITVTFKRRWAIAVVPVVIILAAALAFFLLKKGKEVSAPANQKIIVLPFENLGQAEDEYFADGIAEMIRSRLSALHSLDMISRDTAILYKKSGKTGKQIREETAVDYILGGTVLWDKKEGETDRVRITPHLTRALDDTQLWSDAYDRDIEDIFAVQSEIAEQVTRQLDVILQETEIHVLEARPTENLEAYNLYLQGRFLWNRRTPKDMKKSIEFYEKAIEKDPDFARAYAGIADSYINLGDFEALPAMAAYSNAKKALYKALELNNSLGEAHCSLAWVLYVFEWDFKSAENEFKRAIELNPNYATAHQWYAQYLAAMGRFEEAHKEIDKALELDPLSLIISNAKGQILFFEGRYEDSIEQLKLTLEIDDRFLVSLLFLGWNYIAKGMYQEAFDITQKALSFYEGYSHLLVNSIVIYALSGQREKAQEMFDDLIAETSKTYISSYTKATVYSILGEKDKAFEWLERAYEEKAIPPDFLKYLLWSDDFRSDPRYKAFLKKMNLD